MARITSRALAITATAAALGLLGPVAGASTHRAFTPGALGAGDTYFPDMGNGGYDAQHYDLTVAYNADTKAIDAVAKISARATQNLSRFDLDFLGPLKVSRVTVDGRQAAFTRTGAQELVVTPREGLRDHKKFTVEVAYSGVPQMIDDPALGVSGWIATNDGAVALSQPFGSATWYPVNDTTHDKATYDFTITVPKGLNVLANGVPAGQTSHGQTTTFKWSDREPTASELVMVAIGHYDVQDTRTSTGLRNITGMDPATVPASTTLADQSAAFNKATADVTDWEQSIYGRFPYSATGGINVLAPNVGYSLEAQGRPVYARRSAGAPPSATLLAHELGHQWFGDDVTPYTWKSIWLNEGFATYSEWLYNEQHGGRTAQQAFDAAYNSANRDWTGKVADPGRDHIFDDLVYTRAAMALHMLRTTIGDKAFFKLVKDWPAAHRYGNATTEQFTAFAQRYTKKNLKPLFQTWLYTEGKPAL